MDNIGELLKNARLEQGLSLEQVEEATSIRKIYLSAIEAGNYAGIPGEVFTKGIIRTYGNYLGLNGPELVVLYKAACTGADPEEVKPVEIRTASKITVAPHFKPQKTSYGIFIYLMAFVILIIVGVSGYVFLFSGGENNANVVAPQQSALNSDTKQSQQTVQQNKTQIEADAKKAKARAEQAALSGKADNEADGKEKQQSQTAASDNELELYMSCSDRCWIEVTADGKNVFEGMLVSNQEKTFSAKKNIVVKYGNIQAMKIAVNGTPQPVEKVDGVVIKEYQK